jgi:hypothetical protein
MAELPRYQQTGLLPGDTTRLDFADVKESISMSKGIQSSLDRMSTFAFKEAAERAQREGAQYGAENQPGVEQVMLAIEEGKSPGELFVKPGTAFGDAARKVQAGQLRTELEVRGRQDLAKLSAAIDAGPVDMKEVTTQIKGLTDGFSKALASIDPEESLRFRASMATAGNAVYTKATERTAKIYQEGLQVLAGDSLAATSTILGDTLKVEADPLALQNRFNVERSRVFEVAKQTGDPTFVKSTMEAFDKKRLNAIVDYAITSDFAQTPQEGFRRIVSGQYGKLSEVMKTVDIDRLKKQYIERSGDIISANQKANEVNLAMNLDRVQDIKDRIYKGEISGPAGYKQIKAMGISLPDGEVKAFLHGDLAGATEQVYGRYESMVELGKLGEADLDEMGTKGQMSWKQVNSLKKIARNNDPSFNSAIQFVNAELGVPDPLTPGFGRERKLAATVKSQMINARDVARNSGQPFDPMNVAQEYIKGVRESNDFKVYEQDLDSFKTRLKRNGVNYVENYIYTEEDLKRADVGKTEIKKILDAQKKLQRTSE